MPDDGSAPLTPSGRTAHDWLSRELAKPAYADQRSLLQRLWDWAMDRLQDLVSGVGSALPLVVLIPLLLVIAAVVVFALTRLRGSHSARATPKRDGVLADIELTAEQLRHRAAQEESGGAHSAAFIDFFRALARRAEERALLTPQAGRTAHEVSAELGPYFPAQADELRSAAIHFDRVRYGGASATADDTQRMRLLDNAVEHARPMHAQHSRATP